jgi:cell division protease FtsH
MIESLTHIDNQAAGLKPLALLAAGMTGADIERIVRELRGQCRRQGTDLTWAALETALLRGKNSPSPSVAFQIAVHELGHALAYEGLGVATVTLVRVGGDRGGETHTALHTEFVQNEIGLMKWIACLLAARTAEMLVFGTALAGAGGGDDSDLARATQIAVGLETAHGAAEDMPLLYRPPQNPAEALLYNPLLAERVNRRLETAEAMAKACLSENLTLLTKLASLLVEQIVIDGDELRKLIAEIRTADG